MPGSSADRPPRLQPLTRHRVAAMGAAGAAWAAALPGVLADLEQEWDITVGRGLPGGSASFVARVRQADGGAAVLKVAVTDEGWPEQVATLERAAGRGYARLLRADLPRRAVLLEELGPSLATRGRPVPDQLRRLADTLALAWQDPHQTRAGLVDTPSGGPSTGSGRMGGGPGRMGGGPGRMGGGSGGTGGGSGRTGGGSRGTGGGSGRTGGEDKATGLARLIRQAWDRLDRPCSIRVVDQALAYAGRRAAEADRDLVVVHGDPHPGNLLAVRSPRPGAETGYVFVDPDGFVADRAYDLGVVLRDWCDSLRGPDARSVAEGYAGVLADHTGVDAARIWEWGFLERVSTGLYVLDVVRAPDRVARPYLDSAERLLD